MSKPYAVGLGLVCLVLCAGVLAVTSGAMRISAPVAVPILVMVMGPMLAAGALIGTCSLVSPRAETPVRAEVEHIDAL